MSDKEAHESQISKANAAAETFLGHWLGLPREGLMPHLHSYLDNPQPSLQPHVAIVDVSSKGHFNARLVGTERVALYNRNMTNTNPIQEAFSDEA